jgi:hypothetical protein
MNPRERLLAIGVVGAVALLAAVLIFKFLFWDPMEERKKTISNLEQEIKRKKDEIEFVRAGKPKLERWRQLSLPADAKDPDQLTLTRRLYVDFLTELMRRSGFASSSLKITSTKPDTRTAPALGNKKPIYTKLTFTVEEARGNLSSLVKMLEGFYATGMLDRIKRLDVKRPRTRTSDQRPDELNVSMTIEALVVHEAEKRDFLLPLDRRMLTAKFSAMLSGPNLGIAGLVAAFQVASPSGPISPSNLAQPSRTYASIMDKNIFFGAPREESRENTNTIEINRQIFLTGITRKNGRAEATLRDRYNQTKEEEYGYVQEYALEFSSALLLPVVQEQMRVKAFKLNYKDRTLRTKEDEFDPFPIVGKEVVRITERELIFRRGDKHYAIRIGQSLHEALREPLRNDQLKALQLTATTSTPTPKGP